MRDPDGWTYFKEEVGGLVVGGFEPEAKPWVSPDEIPYPFEFQLLDEDWEHFSVLMDEALHRIPALERDRDPQVLQRPGVASRPTTSSCSGEAPELRRLLRRRRLQLGRHRVRGRCRAGAGRVDRRGRADHRPDRRSTYAGSRRSTRDNGVAARPGRGDPRPALRRAVAEPRAGDRPRRPAARRCTTRLAAAGRGLRLRDGLGAAERLRADGRRGRSTTRGASRPGCPGPRPSSAPAATAVAVFDQTSFSKYVVAGPRRARRAAVGLRRRRRRAGRARRLHAVAQRARQPTRPT